MVTLVGTQANFEDVLKELIELDYDAVEAYEAAINKIESLEYKEKMRLFKADHERHIQDLSSLLKQHNVEPPIEASLGKQWLAKGKVVLANLLGDITILKAMVSNEIDTNTAYENVLSHDDIWSDSIEIIKKGLEDEKRHKAWLEDVTSQ